MNILKRLACGTSLVLAAAAAHAGDPAALEKMDKQWGSATDAATIKAILADDVIGIGPEGMADKASLLEAELAAMDDAPYESGDYKTRFLSDDIAIMVHSAGGEEPHLSMHVWQRNNGKWQVVATASSPSDTD